MSDFDSQAKQLIMMVRCIHIYMISFLLGDNGLQKITLQTACSLRAVSWRPLNMNCFECMIYRGELSLYINIQQGGFSCLLCFSDVLIHMYFFFFLILLKEKRLCSYWPVSQSRHSAQSLLRVLLLCHHCHHMFPSHFLHQEHFLVFHHFYNFLMNFIKSRRIEYMKTTVHSLLSSFSVFLHHTAFLH